MVQKLKYGQILVSLSAYSYSLHYFKRCVAQLLVLGHLGVPERSETEVGGRVRGTAAMERRAARLAMRTPRPGTSRRSRRRPAHRSIARRRQSHSPLSDLPADRGDPTGPNSQV